MSLEVAIIGAGLIGQRRAASAAVGSKVRVIADVSEDRARQLADRYGCKHCIDWRDAIASPDVDAVVVATFNKFLAPITIAALRAGKHVLCEKPMGRNIAEARAMQSAKVSKSQVLKIGFNLRFHPALRKANYLCQMGAIGDLFYLRSVYGHGGRPGYETEWRADPDLAGGGELLDQGVHLLDLAQWFLGRFDEVRALAGSWFWGPGTLEDNAFALLRTEDGKVASLHTSWTQWRNRFEFEIFGRDGYLSVQGLGGSYGTEMLTLGRRNHSGGAPDEESWTFREDDVSWELDWEDFVEAIEHGRDPEVSGADGAAVMAILDEVYRSAQRSPRTLVPKKPTGGL